MSINRYICIYLYCHRASSSPAKRLACQVAKPLIEPLEPGPPFPCADNHWKGYRGVLGRFRAWRELGGGVREIGGVVRGRTEVLGRFRVELEHRQRWERVSLGKAHSEAVRGIESKAGEFYRGGMEGSEKRAREAARSDGLLLDSYRRPDEFYRLKYSMLEERLEQVREIDGELAYEKMRRAVEKASQEKASQERARQETARQSRERRGPERGGGGGGERDFGPSR